MVDRRHLLELAGATLFGTAASIDRLVAGTQRSPSDPQSLELDGVSVRWQHASEHVAIRLDTPSAGWLAIGFNDVATLSGSRFIMADVSGHAIRASERVALVPDHVGVDRLDLTPMLLDASGYHRQGRSTLEVTLKTVLDEQPGLDLRPGSRVYLLLAWSHERDFEHHSAWRRLIPVEL